MQHWNLQSMAVLWAATSTMQEVDLPPLRQTITNAPKHLIWAEAQASFSAMAQQLGMSTYVPVITVALSCALEILGFCTDSSTMLTEGFQPFNLVPAGFCLQVQEAAKVAVDYNHISSGRALV